MSKVGNGGGSAAFRAFCEGSQGRRKFTVDDMPLPVLEERSEEDYLFLKANRLGHLEGVLRKHCFSVANATPDELSRMELSQVDLQRLSEAVQKRKA